MYGTDMNSTTKNANEPHTMPSTDEPRDPPYMHNVNEAYNTYFLTKIQDCQP